MPSTQEGGSEARGIRGYRTDLFGFEFQEEVCRYLRDKFGIAISRRVGLPDIEVVVQHVRLNIEVTSGKGIWYKILDYKERGVPLHAVIVREFPASLSEQIQLLKEKLGENYEDVPILRFDEQLANKLIEIAHKIRQNY